MERRAGVLLHPTSLPGPYGMGDIGPASLDFLQWLEAAGQRIWQMLPIHPVDELGSPYASSSAFARNPLLLSVDWLVEDGILRNAEKPWAEVGIPFGELYQLRWPKLWLAAGRVADDVDLPVTDWALFSALCHAHGHHWTEWPEALKERDADALAEQTDRLADDIRRHAALQWLFDRQWSRLRTEAEARGIELWGDIPIFVGSQSCDVWCHRELFLLDADSHPTVVSGCPPDAFAEEGQLWGHAMYDRAAHEAEGHAWWKARAANLFELFHAARIDHFRGFEAVWEIPAGAETAIDGQWVPGLGAPLLRALREHLGDLPLIAEDLGFITPEVEALRDDFDLPGMAILQFAFGPEGGKHAFLPHNHRRKLVVYPGTHDNPPVRGWFASADAPTRELVRDYLHTPGHDVSADFVRMAYRSVADTAIVAMQDLLGLGSAARMNTPGEREGNWSWRMDRDALRADLAASLAREVFVSGR